MIIIIAIIIIVIILAIGSYFMYNEIKKRDELNKRIKLVQLKKLKELKRIRDENARIEAENISIAAANAIKAAAYEAELAGHNSRVSRLNDVRYAKGGVNCSGNDMGYAVLSTSEECMKHCDESPECVGTAWKPSTNSCWFKRDFKNCYRTDEINTFVKDVGLYEAEENRIILEEQKRIDNEYKMKLQETEQERVALYNKYKDVATQIKDGNRTKDGVDCHGAHAGFGVVDNPYECLKRCRETPDCKGMVYNKNTRECWANNRFVNCRRSDINITSFNNPDEDWTPIINHFNKEFNDRNQRLVDERLTKTGLNCPGNDIANYSNINENQCLELCDKNPDCKAVGMRDNWSCWLKSKLAKCEIDHNLKTSMKDASTFASEEERLRNTLKPEEQEKKNMIEQCPKFSPPMITSDNEKVVAPFNSWPQDKKDFYNKCISYGILAEQQ